MTDAQETVTVTVTMEDIVNGKRTDHQECPVALAVARAFGVTRECVVVGIWDLRVRVHQRAVPGWEVAHYRLPREASDFIQLFDLDRAVSPITFKVKALGSE